MDPKDQTIALLREENAAVRLQRDLVTRELLGMIAQMQRKPETEESK